MNGTAVGAATPPRLERVMLPDLHEFAVAAPDGAVVHGYVTSYEIWDSFVRVNVVLIDRPLTRSRSDGFALRTEDGSFARMVQGGGASGQRFAAWGIAFERPVGPQTASLGLGRDGGPHPVAGMVFTPIMDLPLP